jgi:hypothetical protein
MRNVLLVFLYGEKNNPGKKPVSGFLLPKNKHGTTKHTQQKIMARQEELASRGTPTMTTRLQARQHALQQLEVEYAMYRRERIELLERDPDNPVVERLWKKQYILYHVRDMCQARVRDHLLLPGSEGDYVMECINAVCDGKPNALSAEHPILTTYIKNTYSHEIVTAEVRMFTFPYLDTGHVRMWMERAPYYLWINNKHINFRDASSILRRVHVPELLRSARVMTAPLDGGRFMDYKHATLHALRLTPKKRTK